MKTLMKKVFIKVRPCFIPAVRAYIRHFPFATGKKAYWNYIVLPFFACASFNYKTATLDGSVFMGNTNDLIQRYIYYFGVWEPHLTHWIEQRLSPGDTFVDVGANIGYYSLFASNLVGNSGRVIAIEASPLICKRLQEHVHLNRAENVKVLNVAATNKREKLKIYFGPEGNIGMTSILERKGSTPECEVEGMPLPMILEPAEIKNARLIKIDVEGAEWAVVEGLYPMLQSCRRDLEIVVEINPEKLTEQGKRPDDIVNRFRASGFQAYGMENRYTADDYLPPYKITRPKRIISTITSQIDVVFSRQESEWL